MAAFSPATPEEVLSVVKWAAGERATLEITGNGSKRGIGWLAQTEHTLELSKLVGVTLYEPDELVLSARAGTPIAEIEKLLADRNQRLDFEPMDYGPLHGAQRGRGTIGGALAANLSGPRRLKAGAARDHILGVSAVSGRGEAFKAGGRVVKNVTGYDVSKAMAGSWGTLAVCTDVTFKVLPAAQTETTLAIRGLQDREAAAAMAQAMGSSAEVSSAAHLPERLAGAVGDGALGPEPATLLRLEGLPPSIEYRLELLRKLLATADLQVFDEDRSSTIWRDVRDCIPFADGTQTPVWRVSMRPSAAPAMTMELRRTTPASFFYDWQGGLIWLRMEGGEPEAECLRTLVKRHGGGHATLVRASAEARATVLAFEPQASALRNLSDRVKASFDPHNILNPGRMAG
ncbi:FAD-binding protein (plasmid) [Xanthobacter dioxanivorans]|jgi:glycolate oxidase FAD binding subunit|uniref:FAD-binding protein n=2 Tax=Xanthobacteraceae TaxID=335928 RepID=A0A974PV36_9HYPH|nr:MULTISPECIES: FAD-binding protein [Xanthobacteraceae]QRG10026.1 FAD-binding protein [Xanthobacter dioxanivorans]UOK73452.1 FAD-binding protein [Ancylobacter polymorphus]